MIIYNTHAFLDYSARDMATAHIGGSDDFFIPIEQQLPNPLFIRDELSYDQMVVKLSYPAIDATTNQTFATVTINLDEDFPQSMLLNDNMEDDNENKVEISIIGFGLTTDPIVNNLSTPNNLQITNVDYVPNSICETASQDDIHYSDLVTDDMICAYRNSTGQCNGDSGGPYLLIQDGMPDLQLGIVSFGIGCANPDFPSVGSRTSATHWIRQATCMYSDFAPAYFDCDQFQSEAPSLAPASPTISPQPTVQQVSLTLTIRFDMFPEETGWQLWDDTETIMYDSRPAGTYNASHLDTVAEESIWAHHGQNYTLMITDSADNGMSRWGILYQIVDTSTTTTKLRLGIDRTSPSLSTPTILAEGTGDFLSRSKQTFYVPYQDEAAVDELPVLPSRGDNKIAALTTAMTPSSTALTTMVYLNVTFDSWPSETGWSIVSAHNQSHVLAKAPAGTYVAGSHIMEPIALPTTTIDAAGEEYALIVLDTFGDGILEGGGYVLWMPMMEEENEVDIHSNSSSSGGSTVWILAEGNGDGFGAVAMHNFTIA